MSTLQGEDEEVLEGAEDGSLDLMSAIAKLHLPQAEEEALLRLARQQSNDSNKGNLVANGIKGLNDTD